MTIATFTYPDLGFVHQAWLTEDHRFLFIGDEQDELNLRGPTRTHVVDLLDLEDPQYLYAHEHGNNAVDHNLYVKNNRLYEANYSSGLRVLEFGDLTTDTLTEVAFFDTYPDNNDPVFDGRLERVSVFAQRYLDCQ